MAFITLTHENIEKEHVCCCISDKKGENCVALKKAWLSDRIDEGLVFTKLDQRGKVFIEYIPAEKAWCPITAPDCIYIDCLWVSGQFAGHGYAGELLNLCIEDAKRKGKNGITVLSSKKKRPFLSDPGFLLHKGFTVVDEAPPYFQLMYLPLVENAPLPRFNDCAKTAKSGAAGMEIYYTNQCPHAEKYAVIIKVLADRKGADLTLKKITTVEEAQSCPSPFTTYSFFSNGEFITNEILSEKKFTGFLENGRL